MTLAKIHPHLKDINAPSVLRNLPGWVVWRYEHEEGLKKPRKVPYWINGKRRYGVHGRPEDRQQLATFEAAKAFAMRKGFDGVGFCPMPEWGIVALDFDRCMADGAVMPAVDNILAGTYAEFSPSGQGVRAFFRGQLGNHKSDGPDFGFETFSSNGFVTFTGNVTPLTTLLGSEDSILEVTAELETLHRSRFGQQQALDDDPLMTYEPPLNLSQTQLAEALDVLDPDMPHNDWLHVGMAIHHDTCGQGFDLWNQWSAKGSKYPGERTLRKRWESFDQDGRVVTARTLVKMARDAGARIDPDLASAEDFQAVTETDTPADKPLRFPVIPADQFSNGEPPLWIIKGVLPRAELVVLYGESGAGKSFFALDLAGAMTRGVDWRGLRTRQCRVVYIAAEGGGGFRNRLKAYAQHNEIQLADLAMGVIHAAPNFLQKDDAIEVARAIRASGGADVVIVDTFAQVTPGANENAAEDMGKALAHCKGIHKAIGATVLLVHHSGKDASRGARGWSGLKAAADAEIEIIRQPGGRMARVSKQKDGEDGLQWGFELERVVVGMDEDGDLIESCVVVDAEIPTAGVVAKALGKWEKIVDGVLQDFGKAQLAGIEVAEVLREALRRAPDPVEGKRDTRRQHLRRALSALCEGDESPYFLEGDCISIL